tara:strand:+ start:1073 stop:2965 length:1893 start_codon:yes stop_codon:yes gene_type:complete
MVLSAEEQRQIAQFDENFVKNELYFFELRIPASVSSSSRPINAITPLLINPESITMTEPYAVTPTATVGGGLYVEEDGVIARQLRITGTTGFKPRSAAGVGFGTAASELKTTEKLSFPMRGNLELSNHLNGQSGQRQFQFLQDRIFRLYSDLKQNPDCAANTELIFHNPKDQEHWHVVPLSFTMNRAAPRSTMYMYDIQLLVVEKAKNKSIIIAQRPDLAIVQTINDGMSVVRDFVSEVEGVIKNVEGFIAGVNEVVGNISATINSVSGLFRGYNRILGQMTNTIQGITRLPGDALDTLTSYVTSIDATLNALDTWGGIKPGLYNIQSSFMELDRATNRMIASGKSNPELGLSPQEKLGQQSKNINPSSSQVSGLSGNTTLQGALSAGTGLQPGDSAIDRGRPKATSPLGTINGTAVREITVLMNDTIENISARITGSTEAAQAIIALNNLRPPYISTTGIPGTLAPGSPILVPSSGRAAVDKFGPTVYGADLTEPLASRLFGTDMRLDPVLTTGGEGLYDLVLSNDTEDVQLQAGVENLKQGLRTRILTEIGSDPIYPDLGYRRFVGLNATGFDESLTRLSLSSAVEADERIIGIDRLKLSNPTPDHLSVEFDAIVFSVQDRVQMKIVR